MSWNYYWSWDSDASEVFRDLDPEIWESCEQNPRELLTRVHDLRLWQKAVEPDYIAKIEQLKNRFEQYAAEPAKAFGEITTENPVAYFCAEYGVHNSLPIYSGGLGILAGDHLKSASDMNMPLIAIGLLYSFGYFRQKIGHDGWQQENYHDFFDSERALLPVSDENGDRLLINVDIAGRNVSARVWLAKVGRIWLYLLDTGVPQNNQIDRLITGHLYGGDSETRVVQEKVLGIGGVHLLRKLGITPAVYHLNEGHSAFLTLELAREYISGSEDLSFQDALAKVREKCVFTTHTPVAAGNDNFPPELIEEFFDDSFVSSLKLSREDFLALGRTDPNNSAEWFGMTPLAIRMARSANGVSEKHGE
ncbi:MAG: alpha-glucan family phosphorylase, partial [Acidobacteria bacterium]|nr:alpha-glucan family phosphorylase [Acidobacteriota bacterium]